MSKVTHDFSIEDPGRLLSIPNSDGDASNGPHNPAYQRVLLGEPISRHWRGTVGTFIAKYSGYDGRLLVYQHAELQLIIHP